MHSSALSTAPAALTEKDQALQQAVTSLANSRPPRGGGIEAGQRLPAEVPPEQIVTAIHRLPAMEAQCAPFPGAMDDRLVAALSSRGVPQLYTHQAEAIDHVLAGRHVVVVTPTASGKTLCYNAPVLQHHPAGRRPRARCICFRPRRSRRTSSPSCRRCVETARAADAARDRRLHLRRRHAAGRAPRDPRARARGAQQSRHAPLGHPAAPPALGEAVREPALRGDRRAARVSRRVRQPPDATSCAGCGACAGTTARTRCSSARRPRSPTRASWPRRSSSEPFELVDRERRAARREAVPLRQPAGRQPAARHPALVPRRNAARRRSSS